MRSALTDAPVASFTTLPLEQRSIQPVWWWRLLHFSHRETYSHHKGSFAGHTQGFAIVGLNGRTISSYTKFGFSSSLTEFYQSFVINFIKSFSIGLRFQADGILLPHHRKALFVVGNAVQRSKCFSCQQLNFILCDLFFYFWQYLPDWHLVKRINWTSIHFGNVTSLKILTQQPFQANL